MVAPAAAACLPLSAGGECGGSCRLSQPGGSAGPIRRAHRFAM